LADSLRCETTQWEQVAATTWGSYISDLEREAVLKAHHLAGPPTCALEIGCEGGRWSQVLAKLGWQMICVDVNPRALEICREKIPAATCILADPKGSTIRCDPSSVGLLLCIEVAPVIQSDWFLPEASRVVRQGGLLAGVFWNRASWRGLATRLRYCFGRREPADFYKRSYPAWKRELFQSNFRLIHEEGFCWGPFSRESNSRAVRAFVRMERLLGLHALPQVSPWIIFIAQKS
jgi:SAM-dependent methyltransferase